MTYQQAIDFLFNQLASYQNQGQKAFNKSLDKTLVLLEHLGNPHLDLKCVHVAGTNGKGSSCHMLASVLQESGYKTGLFTSPHLKNFTERIKINGVEVDKQFVVDFVSENKPIIEEFKPSFFEMTAVMAFKYFSIQNVDIAIIETGLGGRLDSTNVVNPIVSLITTIGLDHQSILGNTIKEIALEKAGIIKNNRPVVVGIQNESSLYDVFIKEAQYKNSDIILSEPLNMTFELDLKGNYQQINLPGVLNVIKILNQDGLAINDQNIELGLQNVIKNTGLKGRWQTLSLKPLTICDTAHNVDGISIVVNQITEISYDKLYIVFGMVNDKDIDSVLRLLPQNAEYIFTQPTNERAKSAFELKNEAQKYSLKGIVIEDVNEAINFCMKKASKNDLIYIGGSTFVVAEINEL